MARNGSAAPRNAAGCPADPSGAPPVTAMWYHR
jgi:hypothetical protein